VAERLRSAKTYNNKCALFLGSGCSASAGVPSPDVCVKIVQNEFPSATEHLRQKTFGACLAALSPADRNRMMELFLEGARLNWSHLCAAVLLKEGCVQRVYTPNFDPLLLRACALMGFFPNVYHLDQLASLDPAQISEPAVFYLRGQGAALTLLANDDAVKAHKERLAPVFAQAGSRYLWLVIGYEGKGEPEYAQLAGVKVFEKDLYWVGESKEPADHLGQDLLRLGKNAYYVAQFTADEFLIALCKSMDLFPPACVARPFTFLRGLLEGMLPFAATGQKTDEANQLFQEPLAWAEEAIARYEEGEDGMEEDEEAQAKASSSSAAKAKKSAAKVVEGPPPSEVLDKVKTMFSGQQFKQVVEELGQYAKEALDNDTAYLLSRAHMMVGNGLLGAAKKQSRAEAMPILEDAVANYEKAVGLNPSCYQSLNNWGYALKFQAELHDGPKADRLLKQAVEKYERALQVKPDSHQVFNNWGHALKMRSDRHEGQAAEELLREAISKYQAALAIKDDDFTALHNWGNALLAQADKVGGSDGDRLRVEGMKKMKAAQAVMLMRT
jgi:tetratricopeptide (TPR) repeat protein